MTAARPKEIFLLTPGPLTTSKATRTAMMRDWGSRDMDFRDLLSGIAMNALVVIGARDPATTPAQGEFIAGHLPGARKAVLEGAHLSNIECREEFNRVVLGFLAGAAA